MAMTKKQRVFIEEYLQCWNATEAALRAGYSKRTARSIGSENLTKPDIADAIEKRISEMAMGANEVLIRLGDMARASLEDFVTVYGKGKNEWYLDLPKIIAAGKAHLIKSLVPTQYGLKVELHDKQKALELLGRNHKLFVDRTEITQSGKLEIEYVNDWRNAQD